MIADGSFYKTKYCVSHNAHAKPSKPRTDIDQKGISCFCFVNDHCYFPKFSNSVISLNVSKAFSFKNLLEIKQD